MDRKMLLIVAALALLLILGGGAAVVKLSVGASEEKKLSGLLPHVRARVEDLLRAMAARGYRVLVGSTLRSDAEQAKIVASGNSATSNSWHLVGRAVDLYPYGPDGKPDMDGRHVELYRILHQESARLGFSNLAFNADGSIRKIKTTKNGKQIEVWDAGHVEFREGLTWAKAADQYRATKGIA